jgi:hypothetical protein
MYIPGLAGVLESFGAGTAREKYRMLSTWDLPGIKGIGPIARGKSTDWSQENLPGIKGIGHRKIYLGSKVVGLVALVTIWSLNS